MTEPMNPRDRVTEPAEPTKPTGSVADETFTWTDDAARPDATGDRAEATGATGSTVLESIKDVVDDLAERAAPTVREISAKAAEFAAVAADRAAPLVKKAGEVTADASGKLAEKSRTWAADLRSTAGGTEAGTRATPSDKASDMADATMPSDSLEGQTPTDPSDPSPAFEPDEDRPANSSSDRF